MVVGIGSYFSQYLQLVLGLSPLQTGVAIVPMFAGFVGGAMVSSNGSADQLAAIAAVTHLICGAKSSARSVGE